MTKRAYVPQSKGYDVLDRLIAKGFVEQSGTEKPKKYRAKPLEKVVLRVIANQERFIKRLNSNFESLQNILRAIGPLYERYGTFRLFSPIFSRREAWIRVSLITVRYFQRALWAEVVVWVVVVSGWLG